MNFKVELLRGSESRANIDVVKSVDLEADDLFDIVSRMRIILSSKTYEPSVEGFQIVANGGSKLYYEPRGAFEALNLTSLDSR